MILGHSHVRALSDDVLPRVRTMLGIGPARAFVGMGVCAGRGRWRQRLAGAGALAGVWFDAGIRTQATRFRR